MSDVYHKSVAVLGTGNMGEAIVRGLVHATTAKSGYRVTACDEVSEKLEVLKQELPGLHIEKNPASAVHSADIVVLAVKPGHVHGLLQQVYPELQRRRFEILLISVAAGIRLRELRSWAGDDVRLVRCMPNLPATIAQGVTAVLPENESDWKSARDVLSSVGEVVRVTSEAQLDVATALSAGGPAYACLVIEALADGGVKCGLSREVAQKLAIDTISGTAQYLQKTGVHPAVIRERVCSPGGTTIAALQVLEREAVRAAFVQAIEEGTHRAEVLGQLKKSGEEK